MVIGGRYVVGGMYKGDVNSHELSHGFVTVSCHPIKGNVLGCHK